MNVKELLIMDANKVRHTPSLMSFYIETFVSVFGRKPNCAGCTFAHDFRQLKLKLSLPEQEKFVPLHNINNKNMEKTFKLKTVSNKILKFVKGGSFQRSYDNKMTEDFAIDYLTHGSPEELTQRRKEFSILPEAVRSDTDIAKAMENINVIPLEDIEVFESTIETAKEQEVIAATNETVKEEANEIDLKPIDEPKPEEAEESLDFEETPVEEPKIEPEAKAAPAPKKPAAPKKTEAKKTTAKK